jgi:hypothetical protein
MLDIILENYPEEGFLKADGFDEAIIGVEIKTNRLIYSVPKCLDVLKKEMTYEEAIEYFSINVSGAYMGDKTPIWCWDLF